MPDGHPLINAATLRDSIWFIPLIPMDSVTKGKGVAREFGRGFISVASGYPVTRARADGRPDAEAGCPFAPGVAKRMAEGLVKARERNVNLPVPEVWAVTVDEINPAIDRGRWREHGWDGGIAQVDQSAPPPL